MLDFALAFSVLSQLEEGDSAATVSLTVNYLKAARAGCVEVEGVVERLGARMAFARATITGGDGGLIATATSPMAVIRQT
jgi:uncharacterized protein (TIGR00369 family)